MKCDSTANWVLLTALKSSIEKGSPQGIRTNASAARKRDKSTRCARCRRTDQQRAVSPLRIASINAVSRSTIAARNICAPFIRRNACKPRSRKSWSSDAPANLAGCRITRSAVRTNGFRQIHPAPDRFRQAAESAARALIGRSPGDSRQYSATLNGCSPAVGKCEQRAVELLRQGVQLHGLGPPLRSHPQATSAPPSDPIRLRSKSRCAKSLPPSKSSSKNAMASA